jgi:hypothetical protein
VPTGGILQSLGKNGSGMTDQPGLREYCGDLARAARRLDHHQDAGLDRFGQAGPSFSDRRQLGVVGAVLCAECAGFCAGFGWNPDILRVFGSRSIPMHFRLKLFAWPRQRLRIRAHATQAKLLAGPPRERPRLADPLFRTALWHVGWGLRKDNTAQRRRLR